MNDERIRVYHNISPVFDRASKVLILGSFPSPKSREQRFFYAHPQNRMWKLLSVVFSEAPPMTVEEKRAMLLRHNIAMWDVVASCEIIGASDASIKNPLPNDFAQIFATSAIRAVFTTGRTATKLYRKLTGNISRMLPSPSPANCAASFESLVKEYMVLKEYI